MSRGQWRLARHLALINRKLVGAAAGECRRLILTIPPRHGKSELASKYFPAWYLGNRPDHRVILSSYEANFAAEWGGKVRDILQEVGPRLFGVTLRRDQLASYRWNIAGRSGGMQTAGVGGPITGKGANLGIIDDPIKNAQEAHSRTVREQLWNWFRSTFYSRQEPGAIFVIIMMRWHTDDLVGRLRKEMEHDPRAERWEIVNIPALAVKNDPLGRAPGEALWPQRYDEADLDRIRRAVGSYFWSAIYQQEPYDEAGGLFRQHWFKLVERAPKQLTKVRFWDLAASEDDKTRKHDPDWTVGTLVGVREGRFWLLDQCRIRDTPAGVERTVRQRAELDGRDVEVWIEQEGGAGGRNTVDHYRRHVLVGWAVNGLPAMGSKLWRARITSSAAEAGNILLVKGPWVTDFLEEHRTFPDGEHDDQVDALSGAIIALTNFVAREDADGGLDAETIETLKGQPI